MTLNETSYRFFSRKIKTKEPSTILCVVKLSVGAHCDMLTDYCTLQKSQGNSELSQFENTGRECFQNPALRRIIPVLYMHRYWGNKAVAWDNKPSNSFNIQYSLFLFQHTVYAFFPYMCILTTFLSFAHSNTILACSLFSPFCQQILCKLPFFCFP